MRRHDALFEEVQRLTPLLVMPIVLFLVGLSLYMGYYQLVLGQPVGDNPASDDALVLIIVFTGVLMPAFLLSIRMRTVVDNDGIHVHFFPLKKLDIPFTEMTGYWRRRYSWLKDYGGFGIRLGPDGWAYILHGDQGVQVQRLGGSKVLIGTKKQDDMIQAIRMASGLTESSAR